MHTKTVRNYYLFTILMMISIMIFFMPHNAYAGEGGSEFSSVWDTLKDWSQGTLGRIIAGSMILVGIVGGIVRQSLMSFAIGIGGGMGLYNSSTVIESIMTGTFTHTHMIIPTAIHFVNGLA